MAKRGENIYKRRDGRWEGRYKNGCKSDGKTKYSSVYGKSYSEVRAVLAKKRSEMHSQITHCGSTFKELACAWLSNIKNSVKESTYINYHTKLYKHILPALGSVKYESLTEKNLNDFIITKLAEKLSPKYVADIFSVIKSITRFAHRTYHYADKSEMICVPKDKKGESAVLNDEQREKLTAYFLNALTCSNVGIMLSMYTGLRIGELCALKWTDIDLEKRILTVRRTMQRIKNLSGNAKTKILIDTPKSRFSAREIPLPEFLADALKKIKTSDEDYVLTGNNLFVEPRTMQYRFAAILKKLKLPKVNFHALRHTFATGCIALGFDVKTLSEILGHSSVEITLNRYVHSSIERKRTCMELLNRQIFGQ